MNSRNWFQELVPFRRSSSSKRHRQRQNLLRTLRRECLESRTLMAADVYVAVPTTTPSSTSSYYEITGDQDLDGQLDPGDLVTWNSYQNGPSQSGLTYGTDAFGTISAAISAAVAEDTVNVGAGTFVEQLTIDESITLLGPNAGQSGTTPTYPQAVIVPPASIVLPDPNKEMPVGTKLVEITADYVTIKGVTIDGRTTNGSAPKSNNVFLGVDVGVYSTATGTTVTNCIVQNIFQFGVSLAGTNGTAQWGEISNNKFDNIPYYSAAIAFNDYYAKIDNNSFTNVWVAIQTNNHHTELLDGNEPKISNNVITLSDVVITGSGYTGTYTDVGGIFHNLQYANATPWDITDNTLTNSPVSAGSIGITIWSVSVPATFTGNSITGFEEGYDLWNSPGPISITGNGGNDTIYFSEESRQYSWTHTGGGSYTVTGPNGSVLYVTDINKLVFTDGPVLLLGGAVTGSALCTFDVDPSTSGDQFGLIFTPFGTSYRMSESNPGQFFYNLLYAGGPNTTTNITIDIPYAFAPKGGVPIRIYDDLNTRTRGGESCFSPIRELDNYKITNLGGADGEAYLGDLSNGFYTLTIPNVTTSDDGFIYLNLRLDYSLEKTTGWTSQTGNAAVNSTLNVTLNDNAPHTFSAEANTLPIDYSTITVNSKNKFKKLMGVGGLVQSDQSASETMLEHDPLPGQRIIVIDSAGNKKGDAASDEDGWFYAGFSPGSYDSFTAIWDQDNDGDWQEHLNQAGYTKSFGMGGNAAKYQYVDYTISDPTLDANGNVNSYSSILTTQPDDVSPVVISSDPSDDSTSVPVWSNITLNFSEAVFAGSGNFEFYGSGWSRIIPVTDSQVSFAGSVVTINPSLDLPLGPCYLKISYGAVKDASGNAYAGMLDKRTLNFTVIDQLVLVSTPDGTTTTEAGGPIRLAVVLKKNPTANVTVPFSSGNALEGTASVSSLVFTTTNWNKTQYVTIKGANDNIDDGDVTYKAVIGTVSSTDSNYKNLNPADISLVNIDNDTAGIIVSTPSASTTTESGGKVTFTVKLATQPLYNVTVPVSSSKPTEGSVSPTSLIFTSANWNTPQTVTVTGIDDAVTDGDVPYKVIIGKSSSEDGLYFGIDPDDIDLVNIDNDVPSIIVSATSGTTSESGGVFSFTVKLNSQPTSNVTLSVVSSATTEGTVSPATVTFTSSNWSTPQTVNVTGLDDNIIDGNKPYQITVGVSSTSDTGYLSVSPAIVAMTNLDNDALVTKFYVVDDALSDRTYEYSASGQSVENYGINNTTSRGIATTAAGDKLWVVDSNGVIRVYNNAGSQLGSWTAGSLPVSPSIQGITTDGTHIWLIDSGSKRIYYYANAASRTSATAAVTNTGNYALSTANTNPKDLVFGKSGSSNFLWVVDDGSTDRVYRYPLSSKNVPGTPISWPLSTTNSNSSPTGITLDPSLTSGDLWVLDNVTKQVVKYTNARGIATTTSTAPSSSLVFTASALTNPQGIADPPPVAPVVRVFSEMGESVTTASRNATAAPRSDAWSAAGALVGGNSQNGLAVDRRGSSLAGIPAAVDYRVASAVAKNSTAVRGAALVTDSTLPLNVKKTSQPQSLSAESVDRLFEEFPGTRKRS